MQIESYVFVFLYLTRIWDKGWEKLTERKLRAFSPILQQREQFRAMPLMT